MRRGATITRGAALALAVLVGACSQETPAQPVRYLDRPGDIAFGCTEEVVSGSGVSTFHTVPISHCAVVPAAVPDGGVDATPAPATESWGFVVEGPRGTVAVANLSNSEIRDSDPLTPGFSGLPVGRLPVEIGTMPDGCFVVTANSGSCDLGIVDVGTAVKAQPGSVSHLPVHVPGGAVLGASPAAIAMPPPQPVDADLPTCDAPVGYTYLAYPGCHAVAVVDVASGEVAASIRFGATGTVPTLAGGDLSCPNECPDLEGAVAGTDTGGTEPTVLTVTPEGDRLYVGLWDSPELVIIPLTPTGLPDPDPLNPPSILRLELAIGLRRIAVSGPIGMGDGDVGGTFRFVYALARDNTVHVVDVTAGRAARECDTQIDPRYLHDLSDVSVLACIPIGAYARRAGASGPGIELPFGAVPNDVGFFTGSMARAGTDPPDPDCLDGVFAAIVAEDPAVEHSNAGGRGAVYYVNVDDDNYEDFEASDFPSRVHLPLALAHQLRDDVLNRRSEPDGCVSPSQPQGEGQPRINADPTLNFLPTGFEVNSTAGSGTPDDRTRFLPFPRRADCVGAGDRHQPVFHLSAAAINAVGGIGPLLREKVFPDLVRFLDENLTITWEGNLTGNPTDLVRESGVVRVQEAGKMTLEDPAGEFCDLGVERYDSVQLVGCANDIDCGIGEICFVHPDAPEGSSGLCVLPGDEALVAEACRDVLVTNRRFYIMEEPTPSRLQLGVRPVVMNATPIGGCASTTQCNQIHEAEAAHIESLQMTTLPRYAWRCEAHPAFRGENRCVMTCGDDSECTPGSVCDFGDDGVGRCVNGRVPIQECLVAVQRYQVTASDAFVIVGQLSGYQHHRVYDPPVGVCVDDPTASPLTVARFHKSEPPCCVGLDCVDSEGLTTLMPNPCSFVSSNEPSSRTEFAPDGTPMEVFETRQTRGIRIRLPGVTLDLSDAATEHPNFPGVFYSPLPFGYQILLTTAGGFVAREELLTAAVPDRIRPNPDGSLWIVDSGDAPANPPLRGQIIQFAGGEVTTKIGL